MKRVVPAFALILGWASVVCLAAPAPLGTLRAIHSLSNTEANQQIPVAFEATVTFYLREEEILFVQDGDQALYVHADTDAKLLPGDRVLVGGSTRGSFRPIVYASQVTPLSHGALPRPVPATYDELIRAQHDGMLVTVRAVVRTVDMQKRSDVRDASLPLHTIARVEMLTEGGYIEALIQGEAASILTGLLDAEVEVTGVAAASFDGKMQPTGVQLDVSSLADVKVLSIGKSDPWSLSVTPMDQIISGYHVHDLTQRVRVHGVITYYQPGTALVLQDGSKSLWIGTRTRGPLQIGDIADAIGFPSASNGLLALTHAEVRDSHVQAPLQPIPVTWRELTAGGHPSDLVSIEGRVVAAVRAASQDEYVLSTAGQLFTAIYHHPEAGVAPMKQIPLGSKVRISGICVLEDSAPFNAHTPFNILLRSFDDIVVVARPSSLNIQNLILAVALLLLAVFAAGTRSWILERKVRRQTALLAERIEAEAALERSRSRILEDINGSRPLAEILEQIAGLVAFKLNGAFCWCEVTDGARLGIIPPQPEKLRVVREAIPARLGPPLGALLVGLDPAAAPAADEGEALSMAVRLAALAIETRLLYTDLLHRSEFDLLTDIHNRFSADKHLDMLIQEARRNAGVFGLIYVDLDDFKQVNDECGHQVGDLYLQEVAIRMKHQLRPADILARLGGDEFAVLVPMVRNRAGVEEIALRLERCFDEPFAIEEYLLHGTASLGIALYPEDATSRDGLLSAADAAMYAAKHIHKQSALKLASTPSPKPVTEDDAFSI